MAALPTNASTVHLAVVADSPSSPLPLPRGCAAGRLFPRAGVSCAHVAVSSDRSCAVLADGTVRCWGASPSGAIGASCASSCDDSQHGEVACCLSPVAVAGLSGVAQVALGAEHSCGLGIDGSVAC